MSRGWNKLAVKWCLLLAISNITLLGESKNTIIKTLCQSVWSISLICPEVKTMWQRKGLFLLVTWPQCGSRIRSEVSHGQQCIKYAKFKPCKYEVAASNGFWDSLKGWHYRGVSFVKQLSQNSFWFFFYDSHNRTWPREYSYVPHIKPISQSVFIIWKPKKSHNSYSIWRPYWVTEQRKG